MTKNELTKFLKPYKRTMFGDPKYGEVSVAEIIEALEEQRTGKWIAYKGMQPPELHGKHYCSNCYHAIHLASNGNVYNYCPNCGAKMEMK